MPQSLQRRAMDSQLVRENNFQAAGENTQVRKGKKVLLNHCHSWLTSRHMRHSPKVCPNKHCSLKPNSMSLDPCPLLAISLDLIPPYSKWILHAIYMMMLCYQSKKKREGRMNERRKTMRCFSLCLTQQNFSFRKKTFYALVKSLNIFLSDCYHLHERSDILKLYVS